MGFRLLIIAWCSLQGWLMWPLNLHWINGGPRQYPYCNINPVKKVSNRTVQIGTCLLSVSEVRSALSLSQKFWPISVGDGNSLAVFTITHILYLPNEKLLKQHWVCWCNCLNHFIQQPLLPPPRCNIWLTIYY